jgi:large subunit ribosomal protein L16
MKDRPSKSKFRKSQKGQHAGLSKGGNFVAFGDFGMQCLDRGWVSAKQIEACRVTINRTFQRKGKVWINIFPAKPISKKPVEVRMGKGKGAVEYYAAVVRPGRVMFEVAGVSRELAQDALRKASEKLGVRTRFVDRVEQV